MALKPLDNRIKPNMMLRASGFGLRASGFAMTDTACRIVEYIARIFYQQ
jgi:hypothetical protein